MTGPAIGTRAVGPALVCAAAGLAVALGEWGVALVAAPPAFAAVTVWALTPALAPRTRFGWAAGAFMAAAALAWIAAVLLALSAIPENWEEF